MNDRRAGGPLRSRDAPADAVGRHDWVDAGRGLAIILVVLVHATTWLSTAGLRLDPWRDVNEVLSGLRMPLFFTISGLLGAKWVSARWPALISRKVLLLFWVYLLWQPVGSAASVVGAQITGAPMGTARMLVSLAATPVRPRFELWFLWALSVFFVLSRLTARVPVRAQLAVSAAAAAVSFSALVPEGNLGWSGAVRYYPFFLIGAYHRAFVLDVAGRLRRSPLLVGTVLIGWGAAAVAAYSLDAEQYLGVGLLTRLLGTLAGVGLAGALTRCQVLRRLGAQTLPIYLAHTPLIIPAALLVHRQVHSGWVRLLGPVLPMILTVAVVPLCLLLQRVVTATPARIGYAPPPWLVERIARTGSGREPSRRKGRRVAPAPPAARHANRSVRRYAGRAPQGVTPPSLDLLSLEAPQAGTCGPEPSRRLRSMAVAGQGRRGG